MFDFKNIFLHFSMLIIKTFIFKFKISLNEVFGFPESAEKCKRKNQQQSQKQHILQETQAM